MLQVEYYSLFPSRTILALDFIGKLLALVILLFLNINWDTFMSFVWWPLHSFYAMLSLMKPDMQAANPVKVLSLFLLLKLAMSIVGLIFHLTHTDQTNNTTNEHNVVTALDAYWTTFDIYLILHCIYKFVFKDHPSLHPHPHHHPFSVSSSSIDGYSLPLKPLKQRVKKTKVVTTTKPVAWNSLPASAPNQRYPASPMIPMKEEEEEELVPEEEDQEGEEEEESYEH